MIFGLCLLAGAACEELPSYEGEGGILDSPLSLAVHWPYAYVANANFDLSGDKRGFISIVDLETALVRRDKAILGHVKTKPFLSKIILNADGTRAYVAERRNNSIRLYDLTDPVHPAEIDANPDKEGVQGIGVGRQPYGLALSLDEKMLYTACMSSGHVSIVDLETMQLTKNILLSSGINELKFDPAGKFLYVTNRKFNTVTLLDGASGNIVTSFGIPTQSSLAGYDFRGLDFTPDGHYLFVAVKTPSRLLMVDTEKLPMYPTQAVLRELPMDTGPMGVAVTPDGREAWVTNYESESILAVDARTGTLLKSLPSRRGPSDIQIFARPEEPNYYYALAANFKTHTLTLIDTMTKEVIWSIP